MAKRGGEALDLGSWCILRMSALKTLAVHDSLKKAGFSVWTPIEDRMKRMPRSKARYERRIAMLPTYVFARSEDVLDLLHISMLPTSDHPEFRIFQYLGGFPLIADSELEAMRNIEDHHREVAVRLRRRGKKAPKFEEGTPVRFDSGGFAGMPGTVVGTQGSYTLVDFDNFPQPIKIASLLLAENMQRDDEEPEDGNAAQAA